MFAFLVSASLRNRVLVLVTAAALMLYGVNALRDISVDVLPKLNKSLITILTEVPGLAPEEVESLVTQPIEAAVNGANGVTRVRSVSSTGLSVVYAEFDWDTDPYRNRQIVAERLSPVEAHLPANARPLMAPISSYMGEIMLVAVSSESGAVDQMRLREIADWDVTLRLESVPGVSRVVPIGGFVRQYRVTPHILRMSRLDITLPEVERALSNFGANTGGGFVDQGGQEFLIRNVGRTQSLEDLRNVVLEKRGTAPVLLRQVAEVSYAHRPRRGSAGFMAEPSVIVSITKQPEADTLEVTRRVEAALGELQASMPADVRVDEVIFRQADFIEASIGNVEQVLIEAIIAVSLVLFLFLMNGRTTVISVLAIPMSLVITFAVFQLMGLTINTMTLGGLAIAIGELVDDAVVDVENIYRRLRQNRAKADPEPSLTVIARASQEIRSGIVYSTMIIVLVMVPLFAIPGIEGRLFVPLGIAYIVSILASLITSITLTPVLASYLLPQMPAISRGDGTLLRVLKAGNTRLVSAVLGRPKPVIGSICVAVLLATAVVPTLPRAFLPPFNEGTLVVTMTLDPGISLAESDRIGRAAEALLLQVPEVETVGRRTGRSERAEHALGVHVSEIEVDIRRSERDLEAIMQEARARLAALPATFNIGQPISHRVFDHILTGTQSEIAVKIFGDDLVTLRSAARRVEERLAETPGVTDVAIEKQVLVPQIRVDVDANRAMLYGVQPGDLMQRLSHLTNGSVVSEIVDGVRRFDVTIRLDENARSSQGLDNLLIDTPEGFLPLSHVARVNETIGPNQILRENNRRRLLVTANGDGTNNNAISAELRALAEEAELPPGYYVNVEGIYAEQDKSALRMGGLTLISLAVIFAILYQRYRSAALALVIMGNVPLALIGSVVALKATGLELSIASMIGFITLCGISTRNGILKVSHYINLALHEGESFGRDMILRGSNERLAPVLMTATSACVALVPLLLGAGEAGKEILHPVAVVIFGGLFTATALDAVLTPILFYKFGYGPLQRLAARQTQSGTAVAY